MALASAGAGTGRIGTSISECLRCLCMVRLALLRHMRSQNSHNNWLFRDAAFDEAEASLLGWTFPAIAAMTDPMKSFTEDRINNGVGLCLVELSQVLPTRMTLTTRNNGRTDVCYNCMIVSTTKLRDIEGHSLSSDSARLCAYALPTWEKITCGLETVDRWMRECTWLLLTFISRWTAKEAWQIHHGRGKPRVYDSRSCTVIYIVNSYQILQPTQVLMKYMIFPSEDTPLRGRKLQYIYIYILFIFKWWKVHPWSWLRRITIFSCNPSSRLWWYPYPTVLGSR